MSSVTQLSHERREFDVSPNGETFVVVTGNATPITRLNLVLN